MYKVRHPHGLHADASPYTPHGRHGAGAFREYVVVDHGPAGVQAGHALLGPRSSLNSAKHRAKRKRAGTVANKLL